MLKYEGLAAVGDVIRGYDFQGTKGAYLEGVVIEKGEVNHPKDGYFLFYGYTIDVAVDGAGFGRENDTAYIPFETSMDYDGRVEVIEVAGA
jgi:hypothetical protein